MSLCFSNTTTLQHSNTTHKNHGLDFPVAPAIDLNDLANEQDQTAPHSHAARTSMSQRGGKYIFDWGQTLNQSFHYVTFSWMTFPHEICTHLSENLLDGVKSPCFYATLELSCKKKNSIILPNGPVEAMMLKASSLKQHIWSFCCCNTNGPAL